MKLDNDDVAVVRRILSEATMAILNHTLLKELGGFQTFGRLDGVTRGEVVYRALDEDLRHRLSRVLDKSKYPSVRSFFYLWDKYRLDVQKFARKEHLDLALVEDLAKRWKPLRDKTIAHIDVASTVDPRKLWDDNNVKWHEVETCLWTIWRICDFLYPEEALLRVISPKFLEDDPLLHVEYAPDNAWAT